MPGTHGNNDLWLAAQLRQMKADIAALKARTTTLASVSTGLFLPARAYRNAAFSLTAGAWETIPCDAKSYDVGGYFNTSTGKFVVPANGFYLCMGTIWVGPVTSTSALIAGLAQNSTLPVSRGSSSSSPSLTIDGTAGEITDVLQCAAGDAISLASYSVNADSLLTGPAECFLTVVRIA